MWQREILFLGVLKRMVGFKLCVREGYDVIASVARIAE